MGPTIGCDNADSHNLSPHSLPSSLFASLLPHKPAWRKSPCTANQEHFKIIIQGGQHFKHFQRRPACLCYQIFLLSIPPLTLFLSVFKVFACEFYPRPRKYYCLSQSCVLGNASRETPEPCASIPQSLVVQSAATHRILILFPRESTMNLGKIQRYREKTVSYCLTCR